MKNVTNGMLAAIVVCLITLSGYGKSSGSANVAADLIVQGETNVVFVNVGGAIQDALFAEAVKETQNAMRVNMRPARMTGFDPREIVMNWDAVRNRLGKDVCVAIFVVSDARELNYLNKPGSWSIVSISAFRNDNPTDELYRKRLVRLLMKGMGIAAGIGGNPDPHCVMYFDSFFLPGLDKTSASFGPYAFFPIQKRLRKEGGSAVMISEEREEAPRK